MQWRSPEFLWGEEPTRGCGLGPTCRGVTCPGKAEPAQVVETEWSEGQVRESGRPAHAGAERVVAGKTPEHYRDGAGRSQSAHSSDEGS